MLISNFKSLDKNTLRGVFDLQLTSGFCIHGAMLMSNDKGSWVSFPGIPQYKDNAPLMKDGKQVYKPVLTIPDRDRRDKFSEQVIAALRAAGHVS